MPTDHDHFIGRHATRQGGDGVVDHLVRRVVERDLHARLHGARTHVIAEREPALPAGGNLRAGNAFEQRRRRAERDRHDGNARYRELDIFQARCAVGGRIPRRRRIAVAVVHAAALHTTRVAHGAFGIHITLHVTIVAGIAVDQQRHGAMLLGFTCLDAAKAATVARHHDLSFHRHTHGVEFHVILDQAVIHVHDLGRHVTGGAVAVHGGIL